ncbi:MAG: hypothetical protein JO197_04025 [Acidobacteria bacterium]|nr:hypothetical protein [Acidobacteriota bacterium]MBV9476446.1 hypothetical protein [Acidobacteriota bacterium]
MDENESQYVVCHNGVFVLPDRIVQSLASFVTRGFVYLRQDDDVLTISTTRLEGGYRRALNSRFRVQMFRNATKLAIVDYKESIRVMGVQGR